MSEQSNTTPTPEKPEVEVVEEPKAKPKKKATPKPETVIRAKTREINKLKKELETVQEQLDIAESKHSILFNENKNLKEQLNSNKDFAVHTFNNTAEMILAALNNYQAGLRK